MLQKLLALPQKLKNSFFNNPLKYILCFEILILGFSNITQFLDLQEYGKEAIEFYGRGEFANNGKDMPLQVSILVGIAGIILPTFIVPVVEEFVHRYWIRSNFETILEKLSAFLFGVSIFVGIAFAIPALTPSWYISILACVSVVIVMGWRLYSKKELVHSGIGREAVLGSIGFWFSAVIFISGHFVFKGDDVWSVLIYSAVISQMIVIYYFYGRLTALKFHMFWNYSVSYFFIYFQMKDYLWQYTLIYLVGFFALFYLVVREVADNRLIPSKS